MLISDHRPPVVHGEIIPVCRHRRTMRLVRLDGAAFANPPEPVRSGHLRHHPRVTNGRWLERQGSRGWAVARTLGAVANRALRLVDGATSREPCTVRPDAARDGYRSILLRGAGRDVNT